MRLFASRTRAAGAAQQTAFRGTKGRRWRAIIGARGVARWRAIIAAAGCLELRPAGYPASASAAFGWLSWGLPPPAPGLIAGGELTGYILCGVN